MYNIDIICLGKLSASYYKQAAAEYEKRLCGFCKIKIIEIAAEKLSEKSVSDAQIARALDKEANAIIDNIKKYSVPIAMCIEGAELTSTELAEYLQKGAVQGTGNFVFIIGSSHGLCDRVKSIADLKLSMSKMTFPHELARVMLLEQIYRAFSIIAGGKYHK